MSDFCLWGEGGLLPGDNSAKMVGLTEWVPAEADKLHEEHKAIACIRASCEAEKEAIRAGSQTYFANLAGEMRRPHFGEQFREIYRALLLRAQEAGLYTPEET